MNNAGPFQGRVSYRWRARYRAVSLFGLWAIGVSGFFGPAGALGQDGSEDASSPLSRKQQMIRDRFERFQDQLFRLREELSEKEPENAARLGRALERSGELGLDEQLNNIVEMLNDPSLLTDATDFQLEWMEQADAVLNILLERDSDNDARREELDRLSEYKKQVGQMLQKQKELRDAAAQAALAKRMLEQLDHAIQRVEAAQKRQGELSQQPPGQKPDAGKKDAANDQTDLSRETKQLAEDVKRLSEMKPSEESEDTPGMESARSETKAAADSLEKAAKAMSDAGTGMEQSQAGAAPEQKAAEDSLQEAKEKLEAARRALQEQADAKAQAQAQEALAKKADALSKQMKKDAAAEQGQQGQEGQESQESQDGKSGKQSPGEKSVDQAKKAMDKASKSLNKDEPDEATPEQDRAIDELEKAQQALEEELEALRKEERAEMLRDLEARFRDMLIKQRGVNESTTVLDTLGRDHFKRAERLQVAELAADQKKLADAAAMCLHILEEDATTVVFPRVMEQLGEDMTLVGKRLGDLNVGRLTQAIQGEIVETLEQLLEAVQKMQQENEQDGGEGGKSGDDGKDKPLLPESAELKLLRASQFRVNRRTAAIADAVSDGTESERASNEGLEALAARQKECADIATEMRDKIE